MQLKVKILDDRIGSVFPMPAYATEGSAGMDVCACLDDALTLAPGDCALIDTGVAIFIEDSQYAGVLLPRSGLGHKQGIVLGNGTGLIDADYQGPLKVSCWNRGQEPVTLTPGLRIAQLVILPIARCTLDVVDSFETTHRGTGGFGHTGA